MELTYKEIIQLLQDRLDDAKKVDFCQPLETNNKLDRVTEAYDEFIAFAKARSAKFKANG